MHIIKYILSIFLIIFLSCTKNDDVEICSSKSVTLLNISSGIIEESSEPLSRFSENLDPLFGVYAINIVWKNFINDYEPYASGLFDDMSKANIKLINGHKYRITCSFIPEVDLPLSETVMKDGESVKYYGAPFQLKGKEMSPILNEFLADPAPFNGNCQFYSGSYYGKALVSKDVYQNHPSIHRLYGMIDVDLTDKGNEDPISIELPLYRAYYSLLFKVDGLDIDDSLKISILDDEKNKSFVFKGEGKGIELETGEPIMSMSSIANFANKGDDFGKLFNSEELSLDITYYSSINSRWIPLYSSIPKIKVKRNMKNNIRLIDLDNKISNAIDVFLDSNENELSENNDIEL